MKYHAWLFACLLWPSSALPDTWSGMASKIPGVELLSINKDESGSYVGLLDGESKEFLNHCTRAGMVHVSGLAAPVKCQMGNPSIRGEFFQITLATKEHLRGAGPFVISKRATPPRIQLSDLSLEESEMLKVADSRSQAAISKNASNCFKDRYKELGEKGAMKDHKTYVRSIKASDQYKKFIGKKIQDTQS